MHFKDLLEASCTIYLNKGATGTSLCKDFNEKEHNMIIKALQNHERADYELMDFLDTATDPKVKYSDTLVVHLGNKVFTLYAANARLRMGAGGSGFSGCSIVREITADEVAKAVVNAKLK